jgi:hypothetical protein
VKAVKRNLNSLDVRSNPSNRDILLESVLVNSYRAG